MAVEANNKYYEIEKIFIKYPAEKRFTLAILQDVQSEYGFIPRETISLISSHLNLPISTIYSIATFYKSLSLKPKGKHIIKICNGTACHIRNSSILIDEVCEFLKIKPGETTDDGLFSVETVNCLGACALAPVMVVDGKYYGSMSKDKVKSILGSYKEAVHE